MFGLRVWKEGETARGKATGSGAVPSVTAAVSAAVSARKTRRLMRVARFGLAGSSGFIATQDVACITDTLRLRSKHGCRTRRGAGFRNRGGDCRTRAHA